jgi:hypothetical protein
MSLLQAPTRIRQVIRAAPTSRAMLLRRYLAGETLIEAYWKSVAMPGQGIFIGEPLAAPFRARPQR